jgi:hypothetical protein
MSLGQMYFASVDFAKETKDFDVAGEAADSVVLVAAVGVVDFEGFLPRLDVVGWPFCARGFDAGVDFCIVHLFAITLQYKQKTPWRNTTGIHSVFCSYSNASNAAMLVAKSVSKKLIAGS